MHALHHLFPTVDQSKLHLLVPVLDATCKDFLIMQASEEKKGNSVVTATVEDIHKTLQFAKNRQLTIAGGYWGMCRQVSNGHGLHL